MSFFRMVAIVIGIVGLMAASASGQTAVAIGGPSKELKRTAHQLRISVDNLRNAREALRQATDIARRSPDIATFSQLTQIWIRLDRSGAPAVLEDLYAWLRAEARDAQDTQTYQRDTSAVQALLRAYASLASARAAMLWQQWPDPPSPLGDEFRIKQHESAAQFAKQLAGQGTGAGPGPDWTKLREGADKGDYPSTAALAMMLNQSGDRTEALQLVDRAIANFRQRDLDPQTMMGYMTFLRQLPYFDAERYLSALNAALPAIDRQGGNTAGGTISVGTEIVQLSGAEAAVIDLCRSLTGRPDLAMRTLSSIPGLKSKLDRIGGIDGLVGPRDGSQPPLSMNYSIDGRSRTAFNSSGSGLSLSPVSAGGTAGSGPPSIVDLYESVRGKLAQDPAVVHKKLDEASRHPDQIDALIMLANRANYQEPELASLALEAAAKLIPQVEPLQKRASVFQNLMRAAHTCDGEVDAELLQQGLDLVQQLRDEESPRASANPASGVTLPVRMTGLADQLEMAIVAELALQNFSGALRYVRLMPDDLKLQSLLRIVQALAQP